jgi:hypothetical protein
LSGLHAICAGRVWQEDCADYGTTYSGYPPNPSEDACGHNLSHNKPNLDQGGAICVLPLEPVLGTRPCSVHVTLLKLRGLLTMGRYH